MANPRGISAVATMFNQAAEHDDDLDDETFQKRMRMELVNDLRSEIPGSTQDSVVSCSHDCMFLIRALLINSSSISGSNYT